MQAVTRLSSLLAPRTLAVLGASRDPAKWGHRIISYSRSNGFGGTIYAVNPFAGPDSIPGATVIEDVSRAPEAIDCAFLAIPRSATMAAIEQCAQVGVKNVIVAASGFGELSSAGATEEEEIVEKCAEAGIRLLGPNCFGLFSGASGLNLTPFEYLPAGRVALVSQSGNVAAQLAHAARRRHFGFSHCVGVGNQADLSVGELVAALAETDEAAVIAMYVEGLAAGADEDFFDAVHASWYEHGKRVVVIKAGVTSLASSVAQTHTRSLATDDEVFGIRLERAGAIRVGSVVEMADVLACAQNLVTVGRRVAIVTDGGGDSVMALDALARTGLVPATYEADIIGSLREILPPESPRVGGLNPLTLDTAGGVEDDPEIFSRCIAHVRRSQGVDVVLATGLFGTYEHQRPAEIRAAHAIVKGLKAGGPPMVLQSPLLPTESEPLQLLLEAGVPIFQSVDAAVGAVDALVPDQPRELPSDSSRTDAAGSSMRQLDASVASELLREHGVPMPPVSLVSNLEELDAAALQIGYPICLKTGDPEVVHKSDVGGVKVDLCDAAEARAAAADLWGRLNSKLLLVMPSFPSGHEMIVGGYTDARLGPVVIVGRGGVFAEVDPDRALVTTPITPAAVTAAIESLRSYRILAGYRSQPAVDIATLRDIAVGLGRLLVAEPSVAVDLNPVIVSAHGCNVADFRVMSPLPEG